MKKFWNWIKDDESGVRTLYLDGTIAEESWFDDDVTPKAFKADLIAGEGDIVIWINSPGGDCVAASRIYAMLMDYRGKGRRTHGGGCSRMTKGRRLYDTA